jgi:uncharacterized SAM-binding protein YcdF (DUF218 family)
MLALFYALSKILLFLFQPSSIITLLIAGGIALQWSRFQIAGRRMALLGTLLMVVLGLSPIGGALILPLEQRFPRPALDGSEAITGIILLGGGEDPRVGAVRKVMSLNEAGERLAEGVVLSRRFPQARIVFSGGSTGLMTTKPPEAEVARGYLEALGVDPGRILIDDKSRNTHENALFTMDLVRPKPGETWLLVTSAFHMPRAIGTFRKAGFDVRAFPVDYRTVGLAELYQPFDKIPEGLRRVDYVFKEYVGLVTYYLSGRSSSLFPGP